MARSTTSKSSVSTVIANEPISKTSSMERKSKYAIMSLSSANSVQPLIWLFIVWKMLLLLVAIASPGPGYDTSTRVFLDSGITSPIERWHEQVLYHLVLRLTRWDAIYFASSSLRGHVYEQAWAFSPYIARLTSILARVDLQVHSAKPLLVHALVGIIISHISHLVAVLALYFLTYEILPASPALKHRIASITAALHIISPAGLFLSASYGEAFFAASTFLATYCYIRAQKFILKHGILSSWRPSALLITSGLLYCQSVLARGNGLLSGIIFAWDALAFVPAIPNMLRGRAWHQILHLTVIIISGAIIGAGYAAPQYFAYMEYCTNGKTRPWCQRLPPSIYTFVQDHYWHVGLFRYWTASNIPLFLIATPMLAVLITTAWTAIQPRSLQALATSLIDERKGSQAKASADEDLQLFKHVLPRLALPQLALAVLAATSFHVQIINRISSGYPVWYILLAIACTQGGKSASAHSVMNFLSQNASWLVRLMVMYAMIQGGLYAAFLPPA